MLFRSGQTYQRGFDLDGRINTLTLGPSTATYADLSQIFGYDSLNRLTTANLAAGQTQSFTYDANSNRTNGTVNAATTTYTYPSTNHKLSSLSGATTRSFTYDNAGNVTVSAGITYVHDGRGRMKQAGATTYLVNGLGQRVKKSGGTDTYFAYDEAGRLIGEYDTTGAPIQETIWLADLPIAVVKPNAPSGFTAFYVWADHLGTPRQITDTANVSRWEWAHNDPFGNNTPNENPAGAGAFSYNLRFPGQYFDTETGKHYNYFRDYDPAIGRYAQSDPIGLRGGLNTFGYVKSNPLARKDPKGLFVIHPSCSAAQRQQIENAQRDIQKKLDSSCGGCGGPTGCIPCEHWEGIRRAVDHSEVKCSSDDSNDCGEGVRGGSSITLFPLGFNPSRCSSLKATLLHEAMHNAGLGPDRHRFINDVELSCFGNDAGDRGYPR